MEELVTGTMLKTQKGKTVKIREKLGEGGQGIVYRILYDGKPIGPLSGITVTL